MPRSNYRELLCVRWMSPHYHISTQVLYLEDRCHASTDILQRCSWNLMVSIQRGTSAMVGSPKRWAVPNVFGESGGKTPFVYSWKGAVELRCGWLFFILYITKRFVDMLSRCAFLTKRWRGKYGYVKGAKWQTSKVIKTTFRVAEEKVIKAAATEKAWKACSSLSRMLHLGGSPFLPLCEQGLSTLVVQAADSSHGDQTRRHFIKTKCDDDIASAKRNHFVLKQGL